MKVRLWSIIIAITVVLFGFVGRQWVPAGEQKDLERTRVLLSEICFYPLEGEPGWVEISNWGEKTVDAGGYSLLLSERNAFVLPEGFEAIPPKGIILVLFDGKKGRVEDDTTFEGDKLATLHTDPNLYTDPNVWMDPNLEADPNLRIDPNRIVGVFPKDTGSCSLYSAGKPSAETIVDFVCWGGNDPNLLLKNGNLLVTADAINGGVWRSRFVMTSIPAGIELLGGSPPLERGGSISRKAAGGHGYSSWYICDPRDVSPGARNRLSRPLLRDRKKTKLLTHPSTKIGLTWFGDLHVSYELEIATDKDFTELVERVEVTVDYHVLDDLPTGEYYWRVRRIEVDRTSEWSDIGALTVWNRRGEG